ncbi:MAG: NAD(P)/FAD-dependent oxidoreductase [Spirochaetaceae bacterium]|jgi:electron-transferring-flavoprotein dehydrogenase|nr:NAD(P)/FAD-dependent oxidoreductase [Spirochaetaceae bacterium]
MERETDVLILGACTAGLYFAGLMAKQGYRVLVMDRSPETDLGTRYDIIHIGKEHFARFGLPEPGPGDPDYVETFHRTVLRSALNRWPKNQNADILVLRRAPLMKRLAAWAREQGVELLFDTEFIEPRFDDAPCLSGAIFRHKGGELCVKARLTADASGIGAALRTKLPDGCGVENFITGPRDQFYVVLRYVKLAHPERDKPTCTQTWAYYKTWLAPRMNDSGAILGIGANLSLDYADKAWKRFEALGYLPEHEVEYIEQSGTPYRRPPYSFVADGFVALGDAACITNPWSGEGVPYAWLLCSIAAEEFGRVMKDGAYPTRGSSWGVNTRYQRSQGAEFAQNLAMLSGAVDCTPEENDYEFKHSIIFEDESEKGQHNLLLGLLGGLVTGGLSFRALRNLMGAAGIGSKILKHYRSYPENPVDFAGWAVQAERLWAQTGSMAALAERDMETM